MKINKIQLEKIIKKIVQESLKETSTEKSNRFSSSPEENSYKEKSLDQQINDLFLKTNMSQSLGSIRLKMDQWLQTTASKLNMKPKELALRILDLAHSNKRTLALPVVKYLNLYIK